jgi:hypothetical protein
MLIDQLHSLLVHGWQTAFSQSRSRRRAIEHALALPCVMGRRTISRTLCALGRTNSDWSADYKMFSRSRWKPEELFHPVIDEYLNRYPEGPIAVAIDDTKLRKVGKKIPGAFWQRDPMSPHFHVNFLYGLRFVQASLLFPHYFEGDLPARGYPVAFRDAPAVKKPGRRATDQHWKLFRQARKQMNLSIQTLDCVKRLRADIDRRGAHSRVIIAALDGSFCNKTFFKAPIDRVQLLARCRKDARLCFPAEAGSRRKYDPKVFTPEQVRQQDDLPWQLASVCFGGQWRELRYKELSHVLWKRGAATRHLRLIVIAPVPYKLSPRSRTNYRDPAYLLTTDLESDAGFLVQCYFDRWQIEVNHRDEKDLIGVGQAQVWSEQSVPRQPAFAVACYSLLLLAALREFGPARTSDYLQLPAWRKHAKRPSCLDVLTRLRQDLNEASVSNFLAPNFAQNLTIYAST